MESRFARGRASPLDAEQQQRALLVRRCKKLRGEGKIAWEYLWFERGEGKEASFTVNPVDVGADQGTQSRSGVRCLESLAKAGFVKIITDNPGAWDIVTVDPLVVARARRAHGGSVQPELEFGEEQNPSADVVVAAADVVPLPPPPTFEERALNKPSTFDSVRSTEEGTPKVEDSERRAGGGCGVTTAKQLMARYESLASAPDPVLRAKCVQALAQWILARVDDTNMWESVCVDAAGAIFDGRYPPTELDRVLADLDRAQREGRIYKGRSNYFNRALKRSREAWDRDLR